MDKVLVVAKNKPYLDDIEFFYDVAYMDSYDEAFSYVKDNSGIKYGFFEDVEGMEAFIENSEISAKFIIATKSIEVDKIRRYFKIGAEDVLNITFESDQLITLISEMQQSGDLSSNMIIGELEKDKKNLENEVMEYQILYETTKILRLELEFEEIITKLIQLIEGLSGGAGYFILKKGKNYKYYYMKDNLTWTYKHIRKFLRVNKIRKISEIPDHFAAYYPLEFEDNLWYILPIIIKNSLKGYVILIRKNDEMKDNVIEIINSVLSQAGIVIENAYLIEESQNLSFEMVKSLVKAIEAKDKYTQGHSQRVAALSVLIGKQMNFPYEKLRKLEMAAVLHDVGKIGLPESILNKAGSLTDNEYEIIKIHVTKGYEIVSEIQNMRDIAGIIKFHHERWDGKGYPNKLFMKEIPLESRIISVADTYDAITSDRPYRKGLGHEKAISEIKGNIGLQFDPFIAEVFTNIEKEKIFKITKV